MFRAGLHLSPRGFPAVSTASFVASCQGLAVCSPSCTELQFPEFPFLGASCWLALQGESLDSWRPKGRGQPFCSTHIVSHLLIHLSGLKQQRGLQWLSLPPGTSFSFSDSWVSCVCVQVLEEGLWPLQDMPVTKVRGNKNQRGSARPRACGVPACSWPSFLTTSSWALGSNNRCGDDFAKTAYWTLRVLQPFPSVNQYVFMSYWLCFSNTPPCCSPGAQAFVKAESQGLGRGLPTYIPVASPR